MAANYLRRVEALEAVSSVRVPFLVVNGPADADEATQEALIAQACAAKNVRPDEVDLVIYLRQFADC